MKESIVNAIVNLLKIKSLVTLALTFVFCFLSVKGIIGGDKYFEIFAIVIAFYFGTQTQKKTQ